MKKSQFNLFLITRRGKELLKIISKTRRRNLTKKRTKLKIRDILIISYYHSDYVLALLRLKRKENKQTKKCSTKFVSRSFFS